LPTGDVDGFEPASFAPAPRRACRHAYLTTLPSALAVSSSWVGLS
jgi:hypothetical protein